MLRNFGPFRVIYCLTAMLFLGGKMRKIKILMVGALVASVAGVMASSAVADPAEYQRFTWAAKGKPGTDSKPKPVQLTLNPFHESLGTPPAFLESPPFATVFSHIWFPKQIVFNLSKIPGCAETTILEDPDSCSKDSEVSKKGAGVAAGWARPVNAGVGVGTPVSLENRVFMITGAKNTLAIRVKTPLTTAIMRAVVRSANSSEKKQGWGQVADFTIPIGLIQPAPGLMSQLSDFKGVLAKLTYGGKPMIGLKKCPKSKKLTLAYQGEYNINLSTGDKGMGVTSAANGGFSVNEKSEVVTSTSTCRQG